MNTSNKSLSEGIGDESIEEKAAARILNLGLDLHYGMQLCDALDRYLRGHDKALSVVSVPSPEQEQNRALIRYHRQIISDRVRCEARGKGLLCAQGIEIQGQWWQGAGWDQVDGALFAATITDMDPGT
jgi:hypothetical protein